jgi:thiol:disulfide interchange protein
MVVLLLALLALAGPQAKFGKPDKPSITIMAVTPGSPEVKPGQTFSATFELEIPESWHIYPFGRKSQAGRAPLFRLEGAEIAGPVEQPAAKIHQDKVLGAYEILEGKITVRVPLRLPALSKPGTVVVKGVLDYQICDNNLCVDNKTPFSFKIAAIGDGPAAPVTPPRTPPKASVKVDSARPDRTDVQVGETFRVSFELSMTPEWHIYPADRKQVTGVPTDFVFEAAERVGRVDQPKGTSYREEGVGEYEFFEGKVTMTVPLRLKPGVKPGPFEVRGLVTHQICQKEGLCIAGKTPFSFAVTVLEGKVAPAAIDDAGVAEYGLGALILLGMLGGLISLIMPCTYPMIPITLTYFVKQAAGSRRHGLLLSSLYSLGIILTFTGLGFAMSIILGPGGARIFAANPWVNIVVASMFLWFAGSLFGWYEIKLPGALGQLAGGGQKKGVGGAFILGLLFAVVTFTCTIPIAGVILTYAAGQHRFAALLAMIAYSVTMAMPFFLMGLFPGLIKEVPKGGGWLNRVKVSMAFVEVALAMFYYAKADQTWEFGLLNRWVILGVYVAACVVVALYLLDFLRARPTGARVATAAGFLALGAFFAYGFTGKALGKVEAIIPPPPIHSTTLPLALEEAKKEGKPLFAEFTGVNCSNCQANRGTLLVEPAVTALLKMYVVGELYTDRQNKMDQENNALLNEKFGAALPLYVLFTPDGREVARVGGRPSVDQFVEFLKKGLEASAAQGNHFLKP